MKLDLNKKQTIGTKRTLLQLRNTLRTLLCEKSFENIQVTEICERSMIPKSTFYNYFDDKYDLLHYFLKSYETEINTETEASENTNTGSAEALNNLLDSMDKNWSYLKKIFRYNPSTGYFYQECLRFFIESCYRIMLNSFKSYAHDDLPFELIAKMKAYEVLTVLEWVYFKGHPLSRKEMIEYINKLDSTV